jgi:monofunctional biosynthetic peptidoglycan transglycosylase
LSRPEAARLAAVLPNPKLLRAAQPGTYVERRQGQIERQMAALGGTGWLAAQLQR